MDECHNRNVRRTCYGLHDCQKCQAVLRKQADWKKPPLAIFLFFLLAMCLLAACSPVSRLSAQEDPAVVPQETGPPVEVFFCARQNCTKMLVELFRSASSLDCAFYSVGHPDVLEAFSSVGGARLYVDDESLGKVPDFIDARADGTAQLSHNKFCVVDHAVVLTGSLNPTLTGLGKDANNMVLIHSAALAQNYEEEFEELWAGVNGKGAKVRYPLAMYNGGRISNRFCPEDACAKTLLAEINAAQSSVYFMLYDLTDARVGDALVNAHTEGVHVEGVMDSGRASMPYSLYARLAQSFDVFKDGRKGLLHHKVFIIDGRVVVTGSYNPTKNGDSRNDENILVIDNEDVAALFLDEYMFLRNESLAVK